MLAAIDAWPLAEAIRRSVWAYPALEIAHITGFAILVGSLLTLELRVFGAGADIALRPLARLALRTSLAGFAVAAVSGALMWVSNAIEFGTHPAFLSKLGLLGIAGANAAVFHWRDGIGRHDGVARAQAAFSLVLWLGVISAGRLIAYL